MKDAIILVSMILLLSSCGINTEKENNQNYQFKYFTLCMSDVTNEWNETSQTCYKKTTPVGCFELHRFERIESLTPAIGYENNTITNLDKLPIKIITFCADSRINDEFTNCIPNLYRYELMKEDNYTICFSEVGQ